MNQDSMKLAGNVVDISRSGFYGDNQERVTVFVEGAEPLYAELRVPNRQGWSVGQSVTVVIEKS